MDFVKTQVDPKVNEYKGDKALMRSYMIQTFNEAVLHNELPGSRLSLNPLKQISKEERKLKANEYHFAPRNIQEEIIQFLELNDDVCKTFGLGYFEIMNLHWHEWKNITSLVYNKKMKILEMQKREKQKQDQEQRRLESAKRGR